MTGVMRDFGGDARLYVVLLLLHHMAFIRMFHERAHDVEECDSPIATVCTHLIVFRIGLTRARACQKSQPSIAAMLSRYAQNGIQSPPAHRSRPRIKTWLDGLGGDPSGVRARMRRAAD